MDTSHPAARLSSRLGIGALLAAATLHSHAAVAAPELLVSEVQTSGDGASPQTDEFIEIYSPTSNLSLFGYSIQYRSPTGTFSMIDLSSLGFIPAGGHLLVAGLGYDGTVLADAFYSFDMSDVKGTVIVAHTQALLSG